jgi:uncharacterized membrane protein
LNSLAVDMSPMNSGLKHLLILSLYVLFSVIVGLIFKDGLMMFLGWNMVLVGVAFYIGVWIVKMHQKMHKIQLILMLILWMLLFPNMMYMLTDFIHFQNTSFFINYADVYDLNFRSWTLFLHVLTGAFYGSYLAIKSFDDIIIVVKKYINIHFGIISITVFGLSSLGIYIGRFLRYNSWSILEPLRLLNGLIESAELFTIFFILMFIIIHYFVYFLYHQFTYKPY